MAQYGFDGLPVEDDLMLMRGKGITGHVISSGKSVIIPDVHKDKRYVVGRKAY
jgi:putative methionine-R-sulfoxide reductase with GAF domain